MTSKWPVFETKDLGDTEDDAIEMMRRWEVYNDLMQAIISAGGVHQDDDGWWVDDATGQLIGPDPELERPRTAEELDKAKPLKEALPDLHQSLQRSRGRPRSNDPKQNVNLRLPKSVLDRWQRDPQWRVKMEAILEKSQP